MKLRKKISIACFMFYIGVTFLFLVTIFYIEKKIAIKGIWIFFSAIEIILLILVFIMIYFFNKNILRRVNYLKNEIDNIIINKDLSIRVKDNGEDEINEIFDSFNNMINIVQTTSIEKEKKELRYKALFDLMFSGSFYCKMEKIQDTYRVFLIDINDSYLYNLGYTRDQFNKISKNIDPIKYLDFNSSWMEYFEKAAFGGEYFKIEDHYSELSKEWYNVYIYSNEEGYFTVIYDNVTEKKNAVNDKLRLSNFDTLTNLPNRGLINKKLEEIMISAKLEGNKIGILFMDLVNFKGINDSFGHNHGDAVLKEVGKRLSSCLLPSEFLGRFGGDEFVILKDEYEDKRELEELAKRIITSANKEIIFDGRQYFVDVSIGICLYDGIKDREYNFEKLLKNADIAMYNAKKVGGSSFKFYENNMNGKSQSDLLLGYKLRDALREEFILNYQPIVNCKTKNIKYMEALLRWTPNDGGVVYPDNFIPIAEKTGHIVAIGEWVLKTACSNCRAWNKLYGHEIGVCVNVSFSQIKDKSFVSTVMNILRQTGLSPNLLVIEVTEGIAMNDIDLSIYVLKRLRDFGIRISLDDFGTGYSSLNYVERLPIDILKIDKSFLSSNGENRLKIINSIIVMAHSLNIEVITEGIENIEQFKLMEKLSCDNIQGYLVGKPNTITYWERYNYKVNMEELLNE